MSNLIRDPKTGRITRMRITNAVVQYPALTEPRGDQDLKPGTYGAQLIVRDEETIKLIKEYATEVAKYAVASIWKQKPKAINVPYKKGDASREAEEGATILKANSGFQPKLYIRRPGQRTIALDDNEEFYAGMLADADIVIKDYNVTGNFGVTAYLQAVCKVGDGEPLYTSSAASFDVEDFEDDEAESFDLEPVKPKKKPTTTKKASHKKEETELDLDDFNLDDFNLDDLEVNSEVLDIEEDTEGLTLEDLLK